MFLSKFFVDLAKSLAQFYVIRFSQRKKVTPIKDHKPDPDSDADSELSVSMATFKPLLASTPVVTSDNDSQEEGCGLSSRTQGAGPGKESASKKSASRTPGACPEKDTSSRAHGRRSFSEKEVKTLLRLCSPFLLRTSFTARHLQTHLMTTEEGRIFFAEMQRKLGPALAIKKLSDRIRLEIRKARKLEEKKEETAEGTAEETAEDD